MLEFTEVTLRDKDRLSAILQNEKHRGCEYTFGNIVIWKGVYETKVAFIKERGAVIRHGSHGAGYLFPVGEYNLRDVITAMMEDAARVGEEFRIFGADMSDFEMLQEEFFGKFRYKQERDYAEYVYLSENLRELKGRKYHQKRNHISRFLQNNPNHEFKIIDRDSIAKVRAMNDEWCALYGCSENDNMSDEQCATQRAFENFFELGFDGGFIESEGRVVAYSMGEPITGDTYCVHIEKAFHEIQGSYAMINREFARRFCEGYTYINREDDVGEEGLRKAKLSYHPEFLTEKLTVTING